MTTVFLSQGLCTYCTLAWNVFPSDCCMRPSCYTGLNHHHFLRKAFIFYRGQPPSITLPYFVYFTVLVISRNYLVLFTYIFTVIHPHQKTIPWGQALALSCLLPRRMPGTHYVLLSDEWLPRQVSLCSSVLIYKMRIMLFRRPNT